MWDFPMKNEDFPMKNEDFPSKNGDFPMKNGDLYGKHTKSDIENGPVETVDLASYNMVDLSIVM